MFEHDLPEKAQFYLPTMDPTPQKLCLNCGRKFYPSRSVIMDGIFGSYQGQIEEPDLCDACAKTIDQYQSESGIADHQSRLLAERMEQAGIPPKYRECSLENFEHVTPEIPRVLAFCLKYAQDPQGSFLYLYGTSGTGKTHLAVAIGREMLLQGRTVQFVYLPDFFLRLRRLIRIGAAEDVDELSLVDWGIHVPILILDEVQPEKEKEACASVLNHILTRRDAENRPTIVTSTLPLDQIAKKISPRVASRLGEGAIVRLIAPDYRRRWELEPQNEERE